MRELLSIARGKIRMEEGHQLTVRCAILMEETPDGLEHYGVKITEESAHDSASVFVLTIGARKIYDFIELLANNTVTPTGFMDVVADWL